MRVDPKNWFKSKVQVFCDFQVIEDINKKLSDSHKQAFRKTCFGHFLDIQPFVIQSQLLHHMIMRTVVHPSEQEMWFDINGSKIKFSVNEFALISGLKCVGNVSKRLYTSGVSDRFKTQFFPGKATVSRKAIKDAFNNYSGDSDEEILKLGLLYLISNFCFSKAPGKIVDIYDILLVDSKNFDEFPWGKVCFEMTLASMRTASEYVSRNQNSTDGQNKMEGNKSYRLSGLPLAFQVWAYECIKLVGEYCAHRTESKAARILNWTCKIRPSSTSLVENVFVNHKVNFFFPSNGDCFF